MLNILEKNANPQITRFITTVILLVCLPLLMAGIYQSIQLYSNASDNPANIVIRSDLKQNKIQTNFLNAFAQGGEEATDMLAPILPEIKQLQPDIIRIDHIYDHFNVVQKKDSTIHMDFSQLDTIVSSILAAGATPLLSLSYMPPAIAQNGNIISPPINWNDWSFVIQKTVEHFSGKSGRNIKNMYYEVWNEPDLQQFGGWSLTGEKNYLTLYRYAVIGAEQAQDVQPFFIGGPATTGLYKNWILALMKSGSRIDFFSWHTYADNPKKFAEDQKTITSITVPYRNFAFLPKLVTEFGFTGNKDSRYAAMYAAAHVAAVFRHIAEAPPQYLFSFQLKDGPNQQYGWGLIGHESQAKIKKPRYSVYPFLKQMKGTKLRLEGENSRISALATSFDDTIQVLVVNFHNSKEKSETVPITIQNITPGSYTFQEQFLLGKTTKLTETYTESTIQKELFMPPNSVALLEFTKLPQQ